MADTNLSDFKVNVTACQILLTVIMELVWDRAGEKPWRDSAGKQKRR